MISGSQLLAVGAILGNEVSVGALDNWVHWEKIQAISRHATAGIFAILVFGLAGRLVAWFIPEGHARKVVIWIDDAILIAVLAGFGWELLIMCGVAISAMSIRCAANSEDKQRAASGQVEP